jgi:hypothetical protein
VGQGVTEVGRRREREEARDKISEFPIFRPDPPPQTHKSGSGFVIGWVE